MKKASITLIGLLTFLCFNISFAQSGYLKLGDIKGESTEKGHQDWIIIESFSHALEQPEQITGTARRRVAVNFLDIIISKKTDKSTPKLMELCAKGQIIPKLELELLANNGRPLYKVTLNSVKINGINTNGICNPECEMIDEISVSYSKIIWEYWDAKGNKVSSNYDLQTGN